MPLRRALKRLINGLRRLKAGLPPSTEAVWPGVRNDLFVAHESLYHFASRWVARRRVVDAGCGTGYGSHILAEASAQHVLGVDRSPARISFARRTFQRSNLAFEIGDCEDLQLHRNDVDVVVCLNALEHFPNPGHFLKTVRASLSPAGILLVAVPPILSESDLAAHARNPYHVANRTVQEWFDLFSGQGWRVEFFAHRCGRLLDFTSPYPSTARSADFDFQSCSHRTAYEPPVPITAVYALRIPQ